MNNLLSKDVRKIIRKSGGSLIVTLPPETELEESDLVSISQHMKEQIIITKVI